MKSLVSTWRAAAEDSSHGELTYASHGQWDRTQVEHGWWVTPGDWGLGIGFMDDWAYGRRAFTVEVGPFAWHLTFVKAGVS